MGKIMLKNRGRYYENSPAIKNLFNYIVTKNGSYVDYWGTRGLLKDIDHAYKVINGMQRYLKSNNGRRMYHLMLSFSKDIKDEKVVYIVADAIADYLGKDYQLVYGVHLDTDDYHIHYAMNAVSYIDCKKWHEANESFAPWFKKIKKIAEEILNEYYSI